MHIPNLNTFTGLDPATTPQIQHGSLDPSMQFASAELLAMAMGSIYIQKSVIVGQNCAILGTSACLWLKVGRTQDACNPLGSPKDWRRCCCFTLLEGATPPSPGVDPWCKAQTGDWYLQTPTNGGCKGLWLKIRDDCGANDWINVLGNKCLVTGLTPPDPVALCDYDIGSNYVDLARSCPVVYLKIRDNCDANDWINLSEACVITGTAPDDGDLCTYAKGTYFLNPTTCQLWVKVQDNCEVGGPTCKDWIELTGALKDNGDGTYTWSGNGTTYTISLCGLFKGVTATYNATQLHDTAAFLVRGNADGDCAWYTPTVHVYDFAYGIQAGLTLPDQAAYAAAPGGFGTVFTWNLFAWNAVGLRFDTSLLLSSTPTTGSPDIANKRFVQFGLRVDGVDGVAAAFSSLNDYAGEEQLNWVDFRVLTPGAHTVQLVYFNIPQNTAPIVNIHDLNIFVNWNG